MISTSAASCRASFTEELETTRRERLSAFERFLQKQVELRGKVTYLQIAPKSRTEIPEYADIEQETGAAAGRINGAFGEADWTPIRYVNRAYSHATLAGLYRVARVARTILTASRLPLGRLSLPERRERHASMFQTLSRNDIRHWAHDFLTALKREPNTASFFEAQPVQ